MTAYKKLQSSKPAALGQQTSSPDSLFWNKLDFPVTIKEFGSINAIDFCRVEPYYFAATSSSKVQVFSLEENDLFKSITRFKEAAYGGSFRSDGKLLVAGEHNGVVQLFNVASKSTLRSFKGHKRTVRACKFLPDNTTVASFSDDKTVSLWDVASEKQLQTYSEHQDFVRCGAVCLGNSSILASGSYDHYIRMYDTRQSESTLKMDHEFPIESIVFFPSGGLLVSCGGCEVRIWDVVAGGRMLAKLNHHHKTVTCLDFAQDYSRLVSGSLDRHVKFYDVSSYQVVHTLDYPSPILSLGISPNSEAIVVGSTDGLISIRHRTRQLEVGANGEIRPESMSKSKQRRYFRNVVSSGSQPYHVQQDDVVVPLTLVETTASYDYHLRKFNATKALDKVLLGHVWLKTPQVTVSMLQELMRRGTLRSALAGRSEKSIDILIRFILKNFNHPNFTRILLDVIEIMLDVYTDRLSTFSPQLLIRFGYIRDKVRMEMDQMTTMMRLQGCLEALLTASHNARRPLTNHNRGRNDVILQNGENGVDGTDMN